MNELNLITVLGWEDRFLKGIKLLISKYSIKSIVLISYEDYGDMDGISENKAAIIKIGKTHN